MAPYCSIIIRACNEEKLIGRLLSGILRQSEKQLEIILVDSGSTDATLAITARYPVRVLHLPKHEFTFGRSLNLGLEHANAEFAVIVSAHVYPMYEDWISRLLAPFKDPRTALVYGCQRGNEISRYSEQRVFEKWFPAQSVAIQNHPFCNNANAAIRRALWQTLRYDETLPGLEDLDWAKRALALGYHLSYSAEATVAHVHDETPERIYNRYRREALAFRSIFPLEHFGVTDFARLYVQNVMSDAARALREQRLLHELPGISMFRLMQFWGTYRGFARPSQLTNALKEQFYYPTERRSRHTIPARPGLIDYSEPETAGLETAVESPARTPSRRSA